MAKLFKDPVHGYIRISDEYCETFVDTLIFQRLRNIEQTSMRCLFPAARHDRFIHSLGVFHLGSKAYEALIRNTTDPRLVEVLKDETLKHTFLIACLMHDCGHAPFSHTLEDYYNATPSAVHGRAFSLLKHQVGDLDDFEPDKKRGFKPAAHEAFSAFILLKHFSDKLTGQWATVLAARMITGCRHHNTLTDIRLGVENALISLLNGKAIDVDKLDYIIRDTWASGVKNTAVDMERLVESFALTYDADSRHVELSFKSSAFSVIQSVTDARNYLYEWVYNHHTVHYYAERLKTCLKELADTFAIDGKPDHFFEVFFSEQTFSEPVSISASANQIFLPSDGDILSLMKSRISSSAAFIEYATHNPSRFALWKTPADYRFLFERRILLPTRCQDVVSSQFGVNRTDIIVCKAYAKVYFIKEHDISIDMMAKRPVSFKQLTDRETRSTMDSDTFFYLFLPNSLRNRKSDIILALQEEARSSG